MKVCYLTNIPSPYRVDYFNELGKYCELTVIFERRSSSERNSEWNNYEFCNFKGIILDGVKVSTDSGFSLKGLRYLKAGEYDVIVSTNFSTISGMLQIIKMKGSRIRYCLEADGGFPGSGRGCKEKLKKTLLSGAQNYFSTSSMCDQYFLLYGAKTNQLVRYPFTSLHARNVLPRVLPFEEKEQLRRALAITEQKVVISVGRFSYKNGYGKGFDTLLRVCEHMSPDYGIYIIGDEPTEEFLSWRRNKQLDHLHFVPFVKKDILTSYYQAADVSVLLSRGEAWGLVINESMANGVPVIATKACIAGQELIQNGENGYLVEVNDAESVQYYIESICSKRIDEQNMAQCCLDTARKYTIEAMVECHRIAFETILQEGD